MLCLCVICLCFTACGKDDTKESDGSVEEKESTGTDSSEDPDDDKGYKFQLGSNWDYAYSDTEYDFYYLKTQDGHDANTILSITEDKSLSGVDIRDLEDVIKDSYGKDTKIETGETKENGFDMLYMEMAQKNGDQTAILGQYIVLGDEKAVIFSTYAVEDKYEDAKNKTEKVVNSISFY